MSFIFTFAVTSVTSILNSTFKLLDILCSPKSQKSRQDCDYNPSCYHSNTNWHAHLVLTAFNQCYPCSRKRYVSTSKRTENVPFDKQRRTRQVNKIVPFEKIIPQTPCGRCFYKVIQTDGSGLPPVFYAFPLCLSRVCCLFACFIRSILSNHFTLWTYS